MSNGTEQPRVINRDRFFVAGLKHRGNNEQGELRQLWQRFAERLDEFRKIAASGNTYGVIDNFDEDEGVFDYLAGVEVASANDVPEDLEVWELDGQNYAVFNSSLNDLTDTIDYIYESWMPGSNYQRAPGAEFEFYGEDFDADDPDSRMQIYIPVLPLAGGE